tara:strand:- start:3616 stop:3963 length:348 start_codon:yes stop_codon:yes gene_type:complete
MSSINTQKMPFFNTILSTMTFNEAFNQLFNTIKTRSITPKQVSYIIGKYIDTFHNIMFDKDTTDELFKHAERMKDKFILIDSYVDEILFQINPISEEKQMDDIIDLFNDISINFE